MMKRLIGICIVCMSMLSAMAQTEKSSSVSMETDKETNTQKDFGGFLLDMGSLFGNDLQNQPLWDLGLFKLPTDTKDILLVQPEAFTFNRNVTYTGRTTTFSLPSFQSLFYPGTATGTPVQWQGASYRLNNGIRINTYGEYDADGYKRTNPAALPWQRKNFNAAFEVKSPDGKFGVKLEVTTGR